MLIKKTILRTIILFFLALSGFTIGTGSDAQEVNSDEVHYNKQGMSYFNMGYYQLMAKHKNEEASQAFMLAIKEFQKAIAINQNYIQARRNLARVYYVQKRYLKAVEQYKKVINLDSSDIDTHVILALAYAKTQQYGEAIKQLQVAKTFTVDETVVLKLDGFINKLEQAQSPK